MRGSHIGDSGDLRSTADPSGLTSPTSLYNVLKCCLVGGVFRWLTITGAEAFDMRVQVLASLCLCAIYRDNHIAGYLLPTIPQLRQEVAAEPEAGSRHLSRGHALSVGEADTGGPAPPQQPDIRLHRYV